MRKETLEKNYPCSTKEIRDEAYKQGARELAEWLNKRNYFDGWYKFDGIKEVKLTTDEILAEWQREVEEL